MSKNTPGNSLVNNSRFQALIEKSRRAYREQGGTSIEEVRKELGLPAKTARKTKKGTRKAG
jgi:hypothetical protein